MYFYNYIFHHAPRHYETLRVAGEARQLVPASRGGAEVQDRLTQALRNPHGKSHGRVGAEPAPCKGTPLGQQRPQPRATRSARCRLRSRGQTTAAQFSGETEKKKSLGARNSPSQCFRRALRKTSTLCPPRKLPS